MLSRRECLELLPTVPIGRLVFDWDGYPQAYPVNFTTTAGTSAALPARGECGPGSTSRGLVEFAPCPVTVVAPRNPTGYRDRI